MSSTSMLSELSPNAEVISKQYALKVNSSAAIGLQNVIKSNLGPTGTLKLLVSGSGQLKLTKDGITLLKEMQIQHPTASLIARSASAQDDITGDGTTSTILLIGELLRIAEQYISNDSIHPRIIADGYDIARLECSKFLLHSNIIQSLFKLDSCSFNIDNELQNEHTIKNTFITKNRELLLCIARTSLQTKINANLVEKIATAVVDAVTTVYQVVEDTHTAGATSTSTSEGSNEAETVTKKYTSMPIDLNRIELLTLTRRSANDTRFIKGLVLDHGSRHPDMPSILYNCYIMILNVSLEYESTETSTGFVYSTASEREKLVESERKWLDDRCKLIIQFKRSVCNNNEVSSNTDTTENNTKKSFVIINQKGIDPLSLDMFAKEGILCLRRAKRRNMERLALVTGGQPILSLQDLSIDMLGYAGKVSEQSYGDDKYTFIEDVSSSSSDTNSTNKPTTNVQSCTIFVQGPNQLTTEQIKDSIKDGMRAVKNAIEDSSIIGGGGAFEIAASYYLHNVVVPATIGKLKIGISAFADALLIIPKTLACNSGYDVQDVLIQVQNDYLLSNPNLLETMKLLLKSSDDNDKEEEKNDTDVTTTSTSKKRIIPVGVNCYTGQSMLPEIDGIYDNVRVKRQSLYLCTILANQLLLVDEVMRAGKQMGKQQSNNAQSALAGGE